MHIKKEFIQVRSDPFGQQNTENSYVLRIEVYPEFKKEEENNKGNDKTQNSSEHNTYFSLLLKKNNKLIKEETCLFDEEERMKIVTGKDAYFIILRSYNKK